MLCRTFTYHVQFRKYRSTKLSPSFLITLYLETWVLNRLPQPLPSLITGLKCLTPIPVAARSKAQVCGRSPAEIVGSNPTGGIDICLLFVLSRRGLWDELFSSREVPPTIVRRCVRSRNFVNEEALAR